jgi:hypothetical protein
MMGVCLVADFRKERVAKVIDYTRQEEKEDPE